MAHSRPMTGSALTLVDPGGRLLLTSGLAARRETAVEVIAALRGAASTGGIRHQIDADALGLHCAILRTAEGSTVGRTPRTDSMADARWYVDEVLRRGSVASIDEVEH